MDRIEVPQDQVTSLDAVAPGLAGSSTDGGQWRASSSLERSAISR